MVEDFTNTNSGPASQNVFPGATTTYTFTLTPVGASTFFNDVTVAIDGLPTGIDLYLYALHHQGRKRINTGNTERPDEQFVERAQ